MRRQLDIDHAIAALALRQGGVVSRGQLVAAGLSTQAIDRRVGAGRLHVLHRGVYAVGHRAVSLDGTWLAAVLACGRGAVLSHTSAAAAWELRPAVDGAVHVTARATSGRARRAGISLHRVAALPAQDTTSHRGIPITTPSRTLIDLAAAGMRGRPLEQALDRAELLRLVDFAALRQTLADRKGRPGSSALDAVLSRYAVGTAITRSELEERFLSLCDRHRLPRPHVNTRIEGMEVDFHWPRSRLVVEVDGYAYHRSPSAFETDRARDVSLVLAGYRVLRFTWTQVTRRPGEVASALRRARVSS